MASTAAARETLVALRRQIARIEGTLPERLGRPESEDVVLRGNGRVLSLADLLATGVPALDDALGGGLPKAALAEIHGRQTRDVGAVAGFALALVSLLLKRFPATRASPVLWIGTGGLFAETGFPYAHALSRLFGIATQALLFAEAPKPLDALWIAEEAAALKPLTAVVLELSGNPRQLDLTATRRLHRRAVDAGRPVLLVRQSAEPGPTAAPLRFVVQPAPAGLRRVLGRPLPGSIGPPAFMIDIDKNRLAPPARFILEWNADECTLEQRLAGHQTRLQDPGALVPLSQNGTNLASASGARLAHGLFRFSAAGGQPPG